MSPLSTLAFLAGSLLACPASGRLVAPAQPNPPSWPDSVKVFDPTTPDIADVVNAAYATNGGHSPPDNGQFSHNRYAFLFKPGTYTQDVPVGFYTQVLGLGVSPDDVTFTGAKGVHCEEGDYRFVVGALNTFWRSAENFRTTSTYSWFPGFNGMLWAVSQASPLRRVHVQTDLLLFQYTYGDAAGFASGGYIGNSQVDGTVHSGSQQQWMTRNCQVGHWDGGVWNMVFVGTKGAPPSHCGNEGGAPYVTEDTTPIIAEKPYISIDTSGKYFLNVPKVKQGTQGPDWEAAPQIPFQQVYVAKSEVDTSKTLNQALAQGLHIVFSPGLYQLDQALSVQHPNTVLLGLGLATLVSRSGNAVISVGDVDGVRVAGLLLDAGPKPTPVLLQWGSPGGSYPGKSSNPGVVSDVFARVGGDGVQQVQTDVMFRVSSGNVVADNMWLWRADHDAKGQVYNGTNPCQVGLIVEGAGVTMYGLAVEHTLRDQVQWNGNHGRTYFFQSELPYDVTQPGFGDKGYVGYRVAPNVTDHIAKGVGIYHFFRDHPVTVSNGIVAPKAPGVHFESPLGVFLNGQGTLSHILNSDGPETSPKTPNALPGAHPAWLCHEG